MSPVEEKLTYEALRKFTESEWFKDHSDVYPLSEEKEFRKELEKQDCLKLYFAILGNDEKVYADELLEKLGLYESYLEPFCEDKLNMGEWVKSSLDQYYLRDELEDEYKTYLSRIEKNDPSDFSGATQGDR